MYNPHVYTSMCVSVCTYMQFLFWWFKIIIITVVAMKLCLQCYLYAIMLIGYPIENMKEYRRQVHEKYCTHVHTSLCNNKRKNR